MHVNPPGTRAWTEADAAAVRGIHRLAFPTPAEARLVDALHAAGRAAISRVAGDGEAVLGHILFSPVTLRHGSIPEGGGRVRYAPEFAAL